MGWHTCSFSRTMLYADFEEKHCTEKNNRKKCGYYWRAIYEKNSQVI